LIEVLGDARVVSKEACQSIPASEGADDPTSIHLADNVQTNKAPLLVPERQGVN
jgi:hypothetical protein